VDDETVLNGGDDFYIWREPKPGATLIGTYIGRLLLTERRLLFLSAGTSGLTKAALAGLLGGPLIAAAFGRTRTSELNLKALENEGSLAVPLANIKACRVTRRWDFSSYLTVETNEKGGAPPAFSFMTKLGWNKPFLEAFRTDLQDAREKVLRGAREAQA
jgi:hypothetical protein